VPFVLHSQPAAAYDRTSGNLTGMAAVVKRRYAEIMRDVEDLINDHSELQTWAWRESKLMAEFCSKAPKGRDSCSIKTQAASPRRRDLLHVTSAGGGFSFPGQPPKDKLPAIRRSVFQRHTLDIEHGAVDESGPGWPAGAGHL
jgi:hypothetical protein